jgi:7,8-dihydropterin-6-yl-methyl-4-(beta-D-ribofuranosyl)aminobenzene 5'-phosphate synthase
MSHEGMGPVKELRRLSVTVVTDNYCGALMPDTKVTRRFRTAPGASVYAEHGLSYVVETLTETGEAGRLMFDFGMKAGGVANNLRLLDYGLASIDAFGLSHGHFDHWGGLVGILSDNRDRLGKERPIYVGRDAFAHRFARRVGSDCLSDLGMLDRAGLSELKILRIVEVDEPTEVIPGGYMTGFIDQVTGYEAVLPVFFLEREGSLEQDLFEGEQAMAFVVQGKGLVVLSGCAHRGIVNTVRCAQKISGVDRVHAVIGGFHLINAKPETIEATVTEIMDINPEYIAPAHCTGFEATNRFREAMPEQFILNTAGTTYTFAA